MLQEDPSPVRADGSDKFFGMENVSRSWVSSHLFRTNIGLVWKHMVQCPPDAILLPH